MSTNLVATLQKENAFLKEQVQQLKYYLTGSVALRQRVDDVNMGDTLYCSKEKMSEIVAGMLTPADVCIDIGPGLCPQRLLNAITHVLVEPHDKYARELVRRFPNKLTLNLDGQACLNAMCDKSVDTVFLLDVMEYLEKEAGLALLAEARRVAKNQVIVFASLGFMPQHYTESGGVLGNIEHGEVQNHCSGWMPSEFPNSVSIVCENYYKVDKKTYGAFYAIISCVKSEAKEQECSIRVVLLSESTSDIEFKDNDIIIADISFAELSWIVSTEPKRNCLYVPLKLIAEHRSESIEVLRSTMINFRQMEEYLKLASLVVPVGIAAQEVLNKVIKSDD